MYMYEVKRTVQGDRSFETEKRCTPCKMNIVWIRSDAKMASTYRIVQWPGKRRCARPRVGRACMHRSLRHCRSPGLSRSVGRWLPRPPRSLAGRGSNPLCMSLKDTRRVSSLVVSSMRDVQVVRRSTFESSHSHRPLSLVAFMVTSSSCDSCAHSTCRVRLVLCQLLTSHLGVSLPAGRSVTAARMGTAGPCP